MLRRLAIASTCTVLVATSVSAATAAPGRDGPPPGRCASGARTLSHLGDHVYPDMGNGGYTSLHTDVHLVYDAPSNRFLPGNHVVLTDRATQCLTDFSLDFERTSRARRRRPGPDRQLGRPSTASRPRSASCSRPTRVTRTARTTPTRWPTRLAGHPGRRPGQQPAAAGLLARATADDENAQNGEPVPGEQAGDHAGPPASATGAVFKVTRHLHRPPGRAPRRRRLDRGLVPQRPAARATAGSSPPSRSAPRTGCRSTTTRASSRPTTSTTRSTRGVRRSPTASCCPPCRTRPTRASPAARPPSTGALGDARSPATWSRTASAPTTSPPASAPTASATTRPRPARSPTPARRRTRR